MTLSERYRINNIRKTRRYNKLYIIYFLISLFFVLSLTVSRYTSVSEVDVQADVALWKIAINNVQISQNTTLANSIKIVKNSGTSTVILPGETGYFDIVIDPTDTEVSIQYELTIDFSGMPSDMQITGYSLNSSSTNTFPANNKLSGEIRLDDGPLDSTDKQTYRVYWKWIGSSTQLTSTQYLISTNVNVKQITGNS